MDIPGLCSRCSTPTMAPSCSLCGLIVCRDCDERGLHACRAPHGRPDRRPHGLRTPERGGSTL